jgi:MazG family protein
MLEQDHDSLRRYMIEEAYEAEAVMTGDRYKEFCSELGDVLLQVVLNSQIASENGKFDVVDVINKADEKMIRRHPHVFDSRFAGKTYDEIMVQWDAIKAAEQGAQKPSDEGIFKDIEKTRYPATLQAFEIGKQARKVNFDWKKSEQVFDQLLSEIEELKEAVNAAKGRATAEVKEELSDVYFTLAQYCRHLEISPEVVALDGNRKFLKRFAVMEKRAKAQGIDIKKTTPETLERLWNEAKKEIKS